MRRFHSPRTSPFRLRRLAAFAAVALGLGFAVAAFLAPGQPAAPAATVTVAAPQQPPRIIAENGPAATPSLKAAFTTAPPPPDFIGETAAAKPAVPSAPQAEGRLASIQRGLGGLLDAGQSLITSRRTVAVGKGDTLMDLLVENRVPRGQAHEAIAALAKVYDPRNLNPGHKITVFFHEDPRVADPKFAGLSIEKDVVSTVRVDLTEGGSYAAGREDKAVHTQVKGFSGAIDGSLYVAADKSGVPDNVILSLIKMYSWGVDFQRDIQPGDRFEVMYREAVTEDGQTVGGREEVVYAKLTLSGREMPFYLFQDSTGDSDYYDESGQSAKKPLMKTPIDGARLSSGFGMRRHPVLGYSKMHKGIDFAAPRGTPIYAAGDGTIQKIGPYSSYGKYIRIRHRAGLETAYAHMNGFKAGLKSGSRVKQGQVIGYVGTTGRSTGPHLHYEIMLNGRQVNPSAVKLPTGKALKGKDLKNFTTMAASLDRSFRTLTHGTSIAENRAAGRAEN